MTDKTLDLIHRNYQAAVEASNNILDIVQNLYQMLSEFDIPDEDIDEFDTFLAGLKSSIETRKKTFEMTNLVTEINFAIIFIVVWLNNTQNKQIDINLIARRKSLESELTKLLEKSCTTPSANIRDRFGLRGIILNTIPPEEAVKLVFIVSDSVIGILTKKNRKKVTDFLEWLDKTQIANFLEKERIKFILQLPFKVEYVKDFINEPKPNDYQTLQYTLTLEMYSQVLPGAQLEIQFRTTHMHENAISGSASHSRVYKASPEKAKYRNVFLVNNFSNVHIVGFTSYSSTDTDIDGVHFPKLLLSRRVSSKLVSTC